MSPSRSLSQSKPKKVFVEVPEYSRRVSGLYLRPDNADVLFVFGHGAGAGMGHPFMESMSHKLAKRGIATLRYQFPYMEQGGKRPDAKPVLLATVRSAVEAARALDNTLPMLAGGKSMGGRMTSMSAAEKPLLGVEGIIFLGFPLHPPGPPSSERAHHLKAVDVPLLFLQGTRDKLADLKLLEPVVGKLGALATIHIVAGADHSFHVLRSLGKSDDEVLDSLSDIIRRWALKVVQ